MALLEALACGRPVAAPAAAGPLEIVADGAGRLYAPGDADDGAARRAGAARRPRRARRRRARPGGALPRRGLRRPLRRRRRGGRPVSAFTIVVVLHDSGPELAALLPTLERHARGRASWSSSTPARATTVRSSPASTAPSSSSCRTTRASAPPTTPASPAPATTSPSCSTRTPSWSTTPCMSSRRWRESIRVPCTPPGCSSPTARVQRSAHPAPRHRRRAAARARAPAAAAARAARPRRAVPRRAPPHGRLGDRRVPGRRHRRCCASSARSTRPCTCSRRTWSSACAPAPRGIPTVLHPHLRVRHTGGHSRPPRRRAVRAARPPPARGDRVGARTARPRARRPGAAGHLRDPDRRARRAAARRDPRAGATGRSAQGNRELAVKA